MVKDADVGFVQHGFFEHHNCADDEKMHQHAILGMEAVKYIEKKYDIKFQRVFIYPGCLGPKESIKILKALNFLYSVNAQLHPPSRYCYGMLRSKMKVFPPFYGAIPYTLVYENFPLALRYLPEGAKRFLKSEKYLTPLRARALLALGLPIFVYIHAFDIKPVGENFDCIEWLIKFCKKFKVKSASLEEIGKKHYWIRKHKDIWVIPFYTHYLCIKNEEDEERKYLLVKEERGNVKIEGIYVNGRKIKPLQKGETLFINLRLSPKQRAEVKILYDGEEVFKKSRWEKVWSMITDTWSVAFFLLLKYISFIILHA
jgi:hypothetical protein